MNGGVAVASHLPDICDFQSVSINSARAKKKEEGTAGEVGLQTQCDLGDVSDSRGDVPTDV